jgi:hypothetical protein
MKLKLFRPYLETLAVGSRSGATRALVAGYRYTQYFSPVDAPIVVVGFTANFEIANVRLQLTDTSDPHVWVPFYQTPLDAIAGYLDDAAPVLYLAAPYLMPPGHRIQCLIQNLTVSNISDTKLTLVGVRIDEVEEGDCRVAA